MYGAKEPSPYHVLGAFLSCAKASIKRVEADYTPARAGRFSDILSGPYPGHSRR